MWKARYVEVNSGGHGLEWTTVSYVGDWSVNAPADTRLIVGVSLASSFSMYLYAVIAAAQPPAIVVKLEHSREVSSLVRIPLESEDSLTENRSFPERYLSTSFRFPLIDSAWLRVGVNTKKTKSIVHHNEASHLTIKLRPRNALTMLSNTSHTAEREYTTESCTWVTMTIRRTMKLSESKHRNQRFSHCDET